MKVLHVIEKFYTGGPARSLMAAVKYARQLGLDQEHNLVILTRFAYPPFLIQAKQAGVKVIARQPSPERLQELIEQADIVQVHFWNSPGLYGFLRSAQPAMRLMLWLKVAGLHRPQSLTPQLIRYADRVVATTPATLEAPVWLGLPEQRSKAAVAPGIADFSRLGELQPQTHQGFNVGYVGTVNFSKMHHRYVPMSAAVAVPGVKFIVCGGGIEAELKHQAASLGVAERFVFQGYTEAVGDVLSQLDVFGYPLCPDTYATSEKSLQEAMYAGVPPVVFPHGGLKHLVQHHRTGLVVNTEEEYSRAIEWLYQHPEERRRLGENARRYAQENFHPEISTRQLHEVYQEMLTQPKRQRPWPTAPASAAAAFIDSLWDPDGVFERSRSSRSEADARAADAAIGQASALLSTGEGGITHYRNVYPQDGCLRFWSGLVLQHQGEQEDAIAEFQAALDLGFAPPRLHDYLAELKAAPLAQS